MEGQENRHLGLFEQLDFEGWNGPDWRLSTRLHADDVIVEMMGQRTEGLQAHLDMCRQIVEQNPDMKAEASGSWGCRPPDRRASHEALVGALRRSCGIVSPAPPVAALPD